MKVWYIAIIVFILTWIITGMKWRYSLSKGLLDIPNSRSSHTIPTPSGGGIGIVVSFFLAMAWLFTAKELPLEKFFAISLGGLLVALIGLIDDHKPIPAFWRLIVHFGAFGLAFYLLGAISSLTLGKDGSQIGWFGNFIFLFGLVWLLNLFNFMDGIDGIAGIEGVCTLSCCAIILFLLNRFSAEYTPLIFLAVSCCGFLVWNWPPAKIFMGDVGSGFLGFSIGFFILQTTVDGVVCIWSWLILLGVFLVDASVTLLVRLLRFEKVYKAHCSHAYQQAARKYKSHKKVTITVLIINLMWLFPLATGAAFYPESGLMITIIAYTPLLVLTLKLKAGKQGLMDES